MYSIKEKFDWGKLATFVPNKKLPVYNWFYYKEGFARDLVFKLIKMFDLQSGQTVLEPFCGVGTTPLACKEFGLNCQAFDVSTVALFAAKVKTQKYKIEELQKASKKLLNEKFQRMKLGELPKFIKKAFSIHALEDIVFFKNRINKLFSENQKLRDFFWLALIQTSTKCTYAEKSGGSIRYNKKRHLPPFRKLFKQVINKMIKEYLSFSEKSKQSKIVIQKGDARKILLPDNSIDAIITSPPYLNKIEYTNVYAIEQTLFFDEPSKPAVRSFIGENFNETEDVFEGKYKLNGNAKAYFKDMNLVLQELFRVLKPKGKIALIVGQGCMPERVVKSDELLAELAEKLGFKVKEIWLVNKRWCMKNRTEKVGLMFESIVFLEKN